MLAQLSDARLSYTDDEPDEEPLKAIVQEALEVLTDKQRYVVCRYFGIDCPRSRLQEIADTVGITPQGVKDAKDKALQRLSGTLKMSHIYEGTLTV
jgi:DNA-directed RNA polymerase sigma subunit (sigma70/sigma32)